MLSPLPLTEPHPFQPVRVALTCGLAALVLAAPTLAAGPVAEGPAKSSVAKKSVAPARSASSAKSPAAAKSMAAKATVPATSTAAGAATATATAAACDSVMRRLPNVSRPLCLAAELEPGTGRSVKGVPLFTRDIRTEGAKLRVLVMGGIHGDELSAGSLAIHWMAMAKQPAQMPQPVHWRFIPVLNPDGVLAQPPRRVNANGVDLNRNFPTPNWERDAAVYWEQRTRKDPRRWPGKRPLSEPETRYLHEQMQSFKPHLIVAIHAPYGVLDFDGPSVPPSKLGRLYLDQVGIFPGSLGNYGGVHKGVPVVTIELPNSMRTPLDAEMRQMWLDLLRWMSEKAVGSLGNGGR
ncbi:MAG: DUF2817 domain-containing protein [Ramlibacter sp.]|nr:DUF2817 domain-containing protein [Ramlibacter sp.]